MDNLGIDLAALTRAQENFGRAIDAPFQNIVGRFQELSARFGQELMGGYAQGLLGEDHVQDLPAIDSYGQGVPTREERVLPGLAALVGPLTLSQRYREWLIRSAATAPRRYIVAPRNFHFRCAQDQLREWIQLPPLRWEHIGGRRQVEGLQHGFVYWYETWYQMERRQLEPIEHWLNNGSDSLWRIHRSQQLIADCAARGAPPYTLATLDVADPFAGLAEALELDDWDITVNPSSSIQVYTSALYAFDDIQDEKEQYIRGIGTTPGLSWERVLMRTASAVQIFGQTQLEATQEEAAIYRQWMAGSLTPHVLFKQMLDGQEQAGRQLIKLCLNILDTDDYGEAELLAETLLDRYDECGMGYAALPVFIPSVSEPDSEPLSVWTRRTEQAYRGMFGSSSMETGRHRGPVRYQGRDYTREEWERLYRQPPSGVVEVDESTPFGEMTEEQLQEARGRWVGYARSQSPTQPLPPFGTPLYELRGCPGQFTTNSDGSPDDTPLGVIHIEGLTEDEARAAMRRWSRNFSESPTRFAGLDTIIRTGHARPESSDQASPYIFFDGRFLLRHDWEEELVRIVERSRLSVAYDTDEETAMALVERPPPGEDVFAVWLHQIEQDYSEGVYRAVCEQFTPTIIDYARCRYDHIAAQIRRQFHSAGAEGTR